MCRRHVPQGPGSGARPAAPGRPRSGTARCSSFAPMFVSWQRSHHGGGVGRGRAAERHPPALRHQHGKMNPRHGNTGDSRTRVLIIKGKVKMATSREYADIPGLMRAIRRGVVPVDSVSPGWAAMKLGVSRQRVFQLVEAGLLDCWRTVDGSVILISLDSVKRRVHPAPHGQRRAVAVS